MGFILIGQRSGVLTLTVSFVHLPSVPYQHHHVIVILRQVELFYQAQQLTLTSFQTRQDATVR